MEWWHSTPTSITSRVLIQPRWPSTSLTPAEKASFLRDCHLKSSDKTTILNLPATRTFSNVRLGNWCKCWSDLKKRETTIGGMPETDQTSSKKVLFDQFEKLLKALLPGSFPTSFPVFQTPKKKKNSTFPNTQHLSYCSVSIPSFGQPASMACSLDGRSAGHPATMLVTWAICREVGALLWDEFGSKSHSAPYKQPLFFILLLLAIGLCFLGTLVLSRRYEKKVFQKQNMEFLFL